MRTSLIAFVLPAALTVVCAATLPAQTQNIVYHPNNAHTGGNAFPWGSAGIRYQSIIPGTAFGTAAAVIQDVMVAGDAPNDMEIAYSDIEIRMGLTGLAAPATDWNTNNPNPTTVYRGPLRVRFVVNQWLGIGLPKPYRFAPTSSAPNLCFEVIVWGVEGRTVPSNFYFPPSGAANRAFRYDWVTNQSAPLAGTSGGATIGFLLDNGNFVVAGTGCNSSSNTPLEIGSNTFPQAGKPLEVTLAGAGANLPAILMLGFDFTAYGPINLPFDLAPLGAPGCMVWNDLILPLVTVTDASGAAKVVLPIPNPTNFGRAYVHYWVVDPKANNGGVTTSSFGKILLGT